MEEPARLTQILMLVVNAHQNGRENFVMKVLNLTNELYEMQLIKSSKFEDVYQIMI